MVVVCATSAHREIPFKLKQNLGISSHWDAKHLVLFIISNDSICNVCKSFGQISHGSNDFGIVHQCTSMHIIISSKQSDSIRLPFCTKHVEIIKLNRPFMQNVSHFIRNYRWHGDGKTAAAQISWIYVTNLSQFDTFPYCIEVVAHFDVADAVFARCIALDIFYDLCEMRKFQFSTRTKPFGSLVTSFSFVFHLIHHKSPFLNVFTFMLSK